ncbi:DedA family protein [Arthrobacter sp. 35W]|uniref:DedA family protein n=1 Tax=Arthrobacter sp. 35W TaxID=1132441 RepID=UPI0004011821|nr:DedA family protein [Arthrobacter sp. 35W]
MDFLHIMHQLNELIVHSANQWWVVPMVTLFCLIDGFFLFLPSETAIVALSSVSARIGEPNIWLLLLGGAVGAIIGDNIAYFMGRKLGTTRFRWMRRPRAAKAFDWAKMELNKRGAILIFTARYIPVGRIAVNFTAGATRYRWRRFFVLDFIAAFTWAGYGVAIGTLSGSFPFLHDNPLIGIGIAIVFAIIMGFVVDHAMKLLHGVLDKRSRRRLAAAGTAAAAPAASAAAAPLAEVAVEVAVDSGLGRPRGN